MTAVRKIVCAGFAACALLLTSQHARVAQAADPCPLEDKLPMALARAQQHEREPHEFNGVEMVAGSFEWAQLVDDVFAYAFLLKLPGDLCERKPAVCHQSVCKRRAELRQRPPPRTDTST